MKSTQPTSKGERTCSRFAIALSLNNAIAPVQASLIHVIERDAIALPLTPPP